MGHKNTAKHKASHGGYKQKPSRQAVNALMDLYAGVVVVLATSGEGKPRLGFPVPKPGTQLKLNL
jgi:hypothetical protein